MSIEMVAVFPTAPAADDDNDLDGRPKATGDGRWFSLIERRPCEACSRACGVCAFLLFVLVAAAGAGVEIMAFSTKVPMYLVDHPTKLAQDMELQAISQANTQPADGPPRERELNEFSLELIYLLKKSASLPDVVAQIQEFEAELLAKAGYDSYCQLTYEDEDDSEGVCARHTSFVHYFDPSFFLPAHNAYTDEASWSNSALVFNSKAFDTAAEVDNVQIQGTYDTVMEFYSRYNRDYAAEFPNDTDATTPFSFLVDTNSSYGLIEVELGNLVFVVADSGFGYVREDDESWSYSDEIVALRSVLPLGLPMRDGDGNLMETEGTDFDDQLSSVGEWLFDTYQDDLEDGISGATVFWDGRNNGMMSRYVASMMFTDALLAVGSFFFVFAYFTAVTRSLFLAAAGIGMVLINFVPALLAYRFVSGFVYFGVLNQLAVFILLGIGLDDMFVYLEAAEQVRVEFADATVARRTRITLERAGTAMATTSTTTAVCFMANALSSFPAVYSFGIFNAWLVVFNFLSVILIFPCIVSVYSYYFEGGRACRVRPGHARGHARGGKHELGKAQRWFRDVFYLRVVVQGRFVVAIVAVAIGIVYVVFASQLVPDPETPALFPDDNNYIAYPDVLRDNFARQDDPRRVKVHLVFGIKGIDKSCIDAACTRPVDPTVPTDRGWVEWDDSISDAAEPDAQAFLIDLCADARSGVEGISASRRLVKEADAFVPTPVKCWIESFKEYCDYNAIPFPVGKWDSDDQWVADAQLFEETIFDWLGSPQSADDADYVAGQSTYDVWKSFVFAEDVYGTIAFRFFVIEVALTATVTTPYDEGIELYQDWTDWLDGWKAKGESVAYGEQVMFETGFVQARSFHYYYLQETIIREALQGILLSLMFAFVVLNVATTNWRVSLLSLFVICYMVTGVIAFVVLLGWKLGVLEALALVMVVGLSVDATIHLGTAFQEAPFRDRKHRTQHMLGAMAVSVISGACSTIGASLFLLPAQITFLNKFGTVLLFVISQSLVVALFLFSVLLDNFGPDGDEGNLVLVHKGVAVVRQVGRSLVRHAQAFVTHEPVYQLVEDLRDEVHRLSEALDAQSAIASAAGSGSGSGSGGEPTEDEEDEEVGGDPGEDEEDEEVGGDAGEAEAAAIDAQQEGV